MNGEAERVHGAQRAEALAEPRHLDDCRVARHFAPPHFVSMYTSAGMPGFNS